MPTDLIVPDTSRLSPKDRLSWAEAVLRQTRPGSPASLWLGSQVLRQAAQTELNLLRQSHPDLFRLPSLRQDNLPRPQTPELPA
jgi:hypothetical protein